MRGIAMDADTIMFFVGRADALGLYEALMELMRAQLPPFEARVMRTQISLANRRGFGAVSLPRSSSRPGIVLSLGLGRALGSPRVAQAVQPYPGRWTNHLPLTDRARLDAELMGWIREAYDFAAAKR